MTLQEVNRMTFGDLTQNMISTYILTSNTANELNQNLSLIRKKMDESEKPKSNDSQTVTEYIEQARDAAQATQAAYSAFQTMKRALGKNIELICEVKDIESLGLEEVRQLQPRPEIKDLTFAKFPRYVAQLHKKCKKELKKIVAIHEKTREVELLLQDYQKKIDLFEEAKANEKIIWYY